MDEIINSTTRTEMRTLYVHASEFCLEIADQWHARFCWQPRIKKQIHWKETKNFAGIKHFGLLGIDLYADYCLNVWQLNRDNFAEAPMNSSMIVIYERNVKSPYLSELSDLQEMCEEHISNLAFKKAHRDSLQKSLLRRFKKKELEEAQLAVDEGYNELERFLNRVDELRSIIMNGEKQPINLQ